MANTATMSNIQDISMNARKLFLVLIALWLFVPVGSSLQAQTTQFGPVTSIDWSRDGNLIVTGHGLDATHDGGISIWDAANGQALLTVPVDAPDVPDARGHVDQAVINSDGDRVAAIVVHSGSGFAEVQLINALNGQLVQRIRDGAFFDSIAWEPNGNRLAGSASISTGPLSTQMVLLWDGDTGQIVMTIDLPPGDSHGAGPIAWSPTDNLLAAGMVDGTVIIWDTVSGTVQSTIQAHDDPITDVVWSSDGTRLVTGSQDRTAKLWDLNTGQTLLVYQYEEARRSGITWSPDDSKITVLDGVTRILDATSFQVLDTLPYWLPVAWSPDGAFIASYNISQETIDTYSSDGDPVTRPVAERAL